MAREIRANLYDGNLARRADYDASGAERTYHRTSRTVKNNPAYEKQENKKVAWKEPLYAERKSVRKDSRYQSNTQRRSANTGKKSRRRKKKGMLRKIVRGLLFYFIIAGVIATVFAICSIFGKFGEIAHAEGLMREGSADAANGLENVGSPENADGLFGENGAAVSVMVTPEIRQECQDLYARQGALLTLVNKEHELPASYQPVLRSICKGRLQAADALYDDLCAMLEAGGDAGYQYWIASAHRDRAYQQGLVDDDVEKYMSKGYSYEAALEKTYEYTMPAGYSEHETGLALDILCSTNTIMDESQEGEPGNRWLVEHCHEYGFILRYPADKEDITGIGYEPWHFRYVGKEAAAYLKGKGWTLEEFYEAANGGV